MRVGECGVAMPQVYAYGCVERKCVLCVWEKGVCLFNVHVRMYV